jgi:hypothetical protein
MARVRGSLLVAIVKYLRHTGRWNEVPDDVKLQIGNRVSLTNWYRADTYLVLVKLLAEVLNEQRARLPNLQPGQDIWEYMGGQWVDSYLEHAPIDLTKQTPERALTNFYGFWKLRYDSPPPDLKLSAGSAEIELREHVVVAAEHCSMMKGAIEKLLTVTGAHGVRVSEPRCQARKDDFCQWQVSWRSSSDPPVACNG